MEDKYIKRALLRYLKKVDNFKVLDYDDEGTKYPDCITFKVDVDGKIYCLIIADYIDGDQEIKHRAKKCLGCAEAEVMMPIKYDLHPSNPMVWIDTDGKDMINTCAMARAKQPDS